MSVTLEKGKPHNKVEYNICTNVTIEYSVEDLKASSVSASGC